ncbi:transposase [Microbispora siamensis]
MKKGTHTVGVQRQYAGTAGRVENSQVAVYLVYAGRRGHAAVDRELCIPRSWTARIPTAADAPGWARRPPSRPSQRWPPRWSNASSASGIDQRGVDHAGDKERGSVIRRYVIWRERVRRRRTATPRRQAARTSPDAALAPFEREQGSGIR